MSQIVREQVAVAGMDPKSYRGHSLCAGLATSAVRAGVSMSKVRAQTGHASDATLARYVHAAELFVSSARGGCCDREAP